MKKLLLSLILLFPCVSRGTFYPYPATTGGSLVRIEGAYIPNGGSCTLTGSRLTSPGWISSLADPGGGLCTITFGAGTWSVAPICTCTTDDSNAGRDCQITITPTTSSVQTFTFVSSTDGGVDNNFHIICTGIR